MKHIKPWFYEQVMRAHYQNNHVSLGGRFYHETQHISKMFRLAVKMQIDLSLEQELAILFHDAVYAPGAPTGVNEQASISLMIQSVGNSADAEDVGRFLAFTKTPDNIEESLNLASLYIKSTIDHHPNSEGSKIVIDLDLAGFSNRKEFELNDYLIWQEFAGGCLIQAGGDYKQARKIFDQGRSKWAEQFLDRSKIYHTDEFQKFEEEARKNLKSLII